MAAPIEHFDLSGKRALVYAADSPAGSAVAEALREAGAEVAALDALTAGEVADAVARAVEKLGGIDVLVCAADRFLARPIGETTPAEVEEVLAANFTSSFAAVRSAVTRMLGQGQGGNVVLLTHVLGSRGLPNTAIYSAAHGALQNFIRALAQEVAPEGISINGIALGWMDWMTDRLDEQDPEAARAVRFTMAKRTGTREDLGPMAVWLAGSGAGFVTGQIFPLDGGLTQHL
ncbi:MAG: SDR family NAD(P)-dependent oxidoreductase [Planctomycetota bacterium]|jgi:NAD(P)-dependent dehydrogenase (short-subunit alcohol dehydrogenase family)